MVAAVRHGGRHESQTEPHPGGGQVRTHDEWAQHGWQEVGHDMLYGVGVHGHQAERGRVLMVDLVDVFVQLGVVEQSETNKHRLARMYGIKY